MTRWSTTGKTLFTLLLIVLVGFGCRASQGVAPALADADPTIEREVRAFLDRWTAAFASRNPAAVRGVLLDDRQFIWLEDGKERYPSVDSIVTALASFPPGLELNYELHDVQVATLGSGMVWARMKTRTRIRQGEVVVSNFAGVVSMVIARQAEGWRIVTAHTSNATTRSAG